jgi:hypothetical protein
MDLPTTTADAIAALSALPWEEVYHKVYQRYIEVAPECPDSFDDELGTHIRTTEDGRFAVQLRECM